MQQFEGQNLDKKEMERCPSKIVGDSGGRKSLGAKSAKFIRNFRHRAKGQNNSDPLLPTGGGIANASDFIVLLNHKPPFSSVNSVIFGERGAAESNRVEWALAVSLEDHRCLHRPSAWSQTPS